MAHAGLVDDLLGRHEPALPQPLAAALETVLPPDVSHHLSVEGLPFARAKPALVEFLGNPTGRLPG